MPLRFCHVQVKAFEIRKIRKVVFQKQARIIDPWALAFLVLILRPYIYTDIHMGITCRILFWVPFFFFFFELGAC